MANTRPTSAANPFEIIETLTGISAGMGEWIAGPTPSNPVAAAIQQRYRDQCDSYSRAPSWFRTLTVPSRITMSNLCDPWLDSQGSGGPVLDSPFTGGQCDVHYLIDYRRRFRNADGTFGTWQNTQTNGGRAVNCEGVPVYGGDVLTIGPISGIQARNGTWGWTIDILTDGPVSCISVASSGAQLSPGRTWQVEITGVTRIDGQPDDCGNPEGEPGPNPNPRPDPGLDPDDEPFDRLPGRPVFPMPPITDPFGDPVQLPNFPAPPLFGTEDEGGSNNPNVGPPVTPGESQDGNGTDGEDDDFGDPPEGHIWVGFVVEISDQGVSEGLQPNSPPEPIYRATTGNYRAKYDVEGEVVYSTPREIRQRMSTYFLDLAGLTLTGSRVNVPPNDSYIVTPLSQPVTEEEEPQED